MVRAVPAVALTAGMVLAGCGGDDDGAADGYDDFCDAELAVEQASSSEDDAAMGPAMENLVTASPNDDVRNKVQATIDAFMALEGPPDAAFNDTYGELMKVVKDKCGFHELDVTAKDYRFSGIDDKLDAGPMVVTFENDGTEYHEMFVMRRNEGVDISIEELLALDEEEASSMVTQVGAAFAAPGTTSYTAFDLAPGSYIVACFIPTGLTEKAFDEMMANGTEPQGQPHAMNGMTAEFEVKA
jgi:hypothetical protein